MIKFHIYHLGEASLLVRTFRRPRSRQCLSVNGQWKVNEGVLNCVGIYRLKRIELEVKPLTEGALHLGELDDRDFRVCGTERQSRSAQGAPLSEIADWRLGRDRRYLNEEFAMYQNPAKHDNSRCENCRNQPVKSFAHGPQVFANVGLTGMANDVVMGSLRVC